MSDLVAFLRARLDEDEAAAKDVRYVWPTAFDVTLNPARVLREAEAKRAILDEHSPAYPVTFPEPSGQPACGVCHTGGWDWDPERWPCPTVRALAAVYSGHPDYRAEWKP